ncbi:MAG: hypothetical protein WB711_17310 [Terriglobales bacterium]
MNQERQPSEKDKLEADVYFLNKKASHAVEMVGSAKTKKDREIAQTLLDSLSREIIDTEARIKALPNPK